MARKVLPSKLVDERILVEFDFLNELAWGDSVVSATVEIVVEVGVDPLPQEMLYKVPVVVAGRFVRQQVYNGVPGVIYQVKCTATSTLGNPFEKFVRLAILPDEAQLPLFNAIYLTSRPYPVEDSEGLFSGFALDTGRLLNKFVSFEEAVATSFSLSQGALVGGREFYDSPPEGIDTVFEVLAGDLFGGIVSYNYVGEGVISGLLPLQGTLVGGRVTYDNNKDGLTTNFLPLSGTLT